MHLRGTALIALQTSDTTKNNMKSPVAFPSLLAIGAAAGLFAIQISSSVAQAPAPPKKAPPGAPGSPTPAPVEFKSLTVEQMSLDMALKSKLMMWDGDKFPDNPRSWTAPPKSCKVTITKAESHSGKKCVQLHGDGAAYLGFGFNLSGWYPPDAVWDISNYKNLSFWIRVDAAPGKEPNRLNVHLASAGGKESNILDVETYAPDIKDGQWHEVVVPIKYLLGKEFDPTQCWEIDFGQWSQDPRTFDVYVDEIGVDNREE